MDAGQHLGDLGWELHQSGFFFFLGKGWENVHVSEI